MREDALRAARVLGTVSAVGVLCGWFVAGVLSRLAMLLLVALNPVADGLTSDDGFEMGTFTLSGSANLMFLVGTGFGLLGAAAYVTLRGLRIGPAWFRLLSVSLGGGVVVGSQVVHVDDVDFTLLDPVWLTVGFFVAVPTTYVALLSVASERLLARDRPVSRVVWVPGLLAWVVAFPLLPFVAVLALGFVTLRALRTEAFGRRLLASPWPPWLLRAALAVVFALAVLDLVRDVAALT